MSRVIARAGERIHDEDGNYLCSVAQDIPRPSGIRRLHAGLFTDVQINLSNAHERLPVTAWFVSRVLHDVSTSR